MGPIKKQYNLNKLIKLRDCILPKLLGNLLTYPINNDFLKIQSVTSLQSLFI